MTTEEPSRSSFTPTVGRNQSYWPGHQVHWIQFNKSMREPSTVIPVTAVVDDDGLVHIEGDDLSLVRWNHRPALVRSALERFGGRADWKPRWYLLAVPTEAFMGSARSVFSLAALDERRVLRDRLCESRALGLPRGFFGATTSCAEDLGRARGQERRAAQDRLQPHSASAGL
jgi:hypothetical protein